MEAKVENKKICHPLFQFFTSNYQLVSGFIGGGLKRKTQMVRPRDNGTD
jgi:hypothetical protein